MNAIEQSKRLAAYNAVDRHVRPEDKVSSFYTDLAFWFHDLLQVIGIGSGMNNRMKIFAEY